MQDILNYFNPGFMGKYNANGLPHIVKNCFKVCLYLAVYSFGIGTFLLISYMLSKEEGLMIIGFIFVIAASFLHLFFLSFLFICACAYYKYAGLILQKASVLLLNIPVTILYIYLIFQLNNF